MNTTMKSRLVDDRASVARIREGLPTDRAQFCLKFYVAILNSRGPWANDFRELTDLIAKALRDKRDNTKSAFATRYRSTLHWDRKTGPVLRRIVTKYPTVPTFVLPPMPHDQPYFAEQPARRDLRGTHDLEASVAFGHLREIVAAGNLRKIGRCQEDSCNRYFWGRVGKEFCSATCMRKHMRQTAEYKERNAKHQKNHYDKYFRVKPLGPKKGAAKAREHSHR